MHEISTSPLNINNITTYTGLGVNDGSIVTVDSYSGNTILISFVNANTTYNWLNNIVNIKSSSSVEVIVVMFRHNGTAYQIISNSNVQTAIANAGLAAADFSTIPVLIDQSGIWTDNYLQGILTDPDSAGFSGSFSNYDMISYLVSSDHRITDKWHTECTTNGDPISFNRISPVGTFDSSNFSNTETFISQRITNLNASPTISYANPADASAITNISDIQPIEVVFSKPVVDAADTDGNYTPGGTGGSSLTIGASYTGAGKVENVATLTIGGTLAEGAVTITLGAAITDTATNALVDNDISYTADVTAPRIINVRINP